MKYSNFFCKAEQHQLFKTETETETETETKTETETVHKLFIYENNNF